MPTLDNTLARMREDGSLDLLYRKGLISAKPFQAINIYFKVKSLIPIMGKVRAVANVSIDSRLSVRTIYRSLSLFKDSEHLKNLSD